MTLELLTTMIMQLANCDTQNCDTCINVNYDREEYENCRHSVLTQAVEFLHLENTPLPEIIRLCYNRNDDDSEDCCENCPAYDPDMDVSCSTRVHNMLMQYLPNELSDLITALYTEEAPQ